MSYLLCGLVGKPRDSTARSEEKTSPKQGTLERKRHQGPTDFTMANLGQPCRMRATTLLGRPAGSPGWLRPLFLDSRTASDRLPSRKPHKFRTAHAHRWSVSHSRGTADMNDPCCLSLSVPVLDSVLWSEHRSRCTIGSLDDEGIRGRMVDERICATRLSQCITRKSICHALRCVDILFCVR